LLTDDTTQQQQQRRRRRRLPESRQRDFRETKHNSRIILALLMLFLLCTVSV